MEWFLVFLVSINMVLLVKNYRVVSGSAALAERTRGKCLETRLEPAKPEGKWLYPRGDKCVLELGHTAKHYSTETDTFW